MSYLKAHLPTLIGVCIFVLLFATYIYTAAPTISGYGDSNEIITIGKLLGVAHPSGYPLTIMLVHLVGNLPLPGNFAYHANLLAGFFHALGAVMIYLACQELLHQLFPKSEPKFRLISASLTSLILGYSALYWLYASVMEVNALNSFLAGLVIFSALKWRRCLLEDLDSRHQLIWLVATLASIALGLSNVQTFILLLPGLLYLFILTLNQTHQWSTYRTPTKAILIILTPITIFFGVNLLLFWLNSQQADFSWHFNQDFRGWWRMITRADYRGYIPEQDLAINAYLSNKDLGHYLTGAWGYVTFLLQHFTAYGFVLGTLGILWISSKRHALSYFPLILWLISGLWFASYMSQPEGGLANLQYRSVLGITHRQYLLGYISWSLLISIGIYSLLQWAKQKSALHLRSFLIILILLLPLHIHANNSMGNQRHNYFSHEHAQLLLDSAEPDSVMICFSDISCFALLYLQKVENYRPDVTVLIKNEKYQKYFHQRNPKYLGFYYDSNPNFTAELISWNVAHRTAYLTEPNGYYINYLGLEGNPFYLIPHNNYLYKIVTRIPDSLSQPDYTLSEKLLLAPIPSKNYFLDGHKDYLAHIHSVYGVMYSKLGDEPNARKNFEYAIALNPEFAEPRTFLGQLDNYAGDANYAYGKSSPTAQDLYAQYQALDLQSTQTQDNDLLNQAYLTLLKATFMEPLNSDLRLELALFYKRGGYFNQARDELNYILTHQPDHQAAKQELLLLDPAH